MGPITFDKNNHCHHYDIQPTSSHFKSSSDDHSVYILQDMQEMGSTLPTLHLSSPTPSPLEFEWSAEDWNDNRHREREERKKEQQEKEEAEKNKKEDSA